MDKAQAHRDWAKKQYEKLCPVQNATAKNIIDAVVVEFKANGSKAATAKFNTLAAEHKLQRWVAVALTDTIRGLVL
jgi:hypothetical protein